MAAAWAIVTVAEMWKYLEITDSSKDVILDFIIDHVSKSIESYVHRKVKSQPITDERHSGNGLDNWLRLRYAPVVSITSLYDDTSWVFGADSLLVENTDFVVDKEAGIIYHESSAGAGTAFWRGKQNIKVTYVAGWVTVPDDLVWACKMQVAEDFRKQQGKRLDRVSQSRGDGSVSYQLTGWLPQVKELLDKWVLQGR
jgi:hypothetical protein